MVDTETKDLVAGFEKAVQKIIHERETDKEAYEARQAEFLRREEMVRQAIDGLTGNGHGPLLSEKDKVAGLSISDERVQQVLGFLRKHPRSRQVEITKKLKLNSGTVSVALRKLEADGQVQKGDREGKDGRTSRVWILPEVNGNGSRETVVHPGEGVRKGRRMSLAA